MKPFIIHKMTFKVQSRSLAMSSFVRSPGLSIRVHGQTKIAEMTCKVDRDHWWWHNTV